MRIDQIVKVSMINVFFAFAISSCTKEDNTLVSADRQTKGNNKVSEAERKEYKDEGAKFLVDAAKMNVEEIQFSKLAETNGQSAEIKRLAKMLQSEHTRSFKKVQAMAAAKMIDIPTMLTLKKEEEYNKMTRTKGADFDKEYADMMVDGHKDVIDRFEAAVKDVKDAEINAWAKSMLPYLKDHLLHAQNVKETVK